MKKSVIVNIMSDLAFWVSWPYSYLRLQRAERTRVLVVTSDNYVLLVREWYASNRWSLPGGGVRPQESHVHAAARELLEETSIALGEEQFRYAGKAIVTDRGLRFRCQFYIQKKSLFLSPYQIKHNTHQGLNPKYQ